MLGFAPGLVPDEDVLQIEGHFHPSLVALRRVFCQGARQNVIKSRGEIQIESRGGHGFVADHLEGDRNGTVTLKRPVTGEKHVENHAEGKEIGTTVDWFVVQLLRRHERWHSQDLTAECQVSVEVQLGDAKIGYFRVTFFGQQNIGRLKITVNNALPVRTIKCLREFDCQANGYIWSRLPFLMKLSVERPAADVLHDEIRIMCVGFLAHVKNGDDTGMREAPRGFSLAQKPLAKLTKCFARLMGKRDAFDGDRAVDLWIPSSVHHAHGASSDFVEDFVSPEASITGGIHPAAFA